MVQIYQDNILNQYDNVTYNWTIHMMRPEDVNLYNEAIGLGRTKIIAQSGVESEINITSVEHNMKMAHNKTMPDREAVGNVFSFTLTEPQGATLYTRIYEAARQLNIINHLKACYLLELKFLGYDTQGNPIDSIVTPYYYACTLTGLDFNYADGGTSYRGDFIETTQDAFKSLVLSIKEDIQISASDYGTYISELERIVNEQEQKQVVTSMARDLWHTYKFGYGEGAEDWASWGFDTGSGSKPNTDKLGSVSITGSGNLTFTIKRGALLNDLMILGLMQTKEFRRLPTAENGFHKQSPNDDEADAPTFADLSKWFTFDTKTTYDVYDSTARDFAKIFDIKIQAIITPELHHDVVSYDKLIKSESLQKERLKNLIRKGLLKKRFDYYYTGLNTEVMSLDIYLNTTYYQIQALNQGAGKFIANTQAGEGGPGTEFSRTKSDFGKLSKQIQAAKDEIAKLQREIEGLQKAPIDSTSPTVELHSRSLKIENNKEAIKKQQELVKQLEIEQEKLIPVLQELTKNEQARRRLEQGDVDKITGAKYLTQRDLVGRQNTNRETHPLTHSTQNINSKATNGPDEGDTSGAVYLGAVELNLNTLGDLVQQTIMIRGDPYWLGRPKSRKAKLTGQADYQTGGVSYFLNLNFPTYPDENTGLMNIPEANYGIVGMYRVFEVTANYSEGQFTMTLNSFRDINTNVGLVWDYLSTGEVDLEPAKKGEPLKLPEDQGEGDQEGNELEDLTGPELIEEGLTTGDVTNPTVTEAQLTNGATRNKPIKPKLKNILQSAAEATGLNVVVFSGGMDTQLTGTTRHLDGGAADIRLFTADGTQLTLDNSDHLPLVQNFLKKAKDFGATGIGAGNGYMGNDGFHIDIAKELGNTGPNSTPYWGGPQARAHLAEQWLKDIMLG